MISPSLAVAVTSSSRGQRLALDRERVIADHREALRQRGVDAAAVVAQHIGLAVHQAPRADDLAAERRADRLVAEADAEDRQLAGELADRVDADAGLGRRARARREHERVGAQRADAGDIDLVVANHAHVFSQLAEVLDQIEREAVVVVDHQQHQKPSSTSSAARMQGARLRLGLLPFELGHRIGDDAGRRLHVQHPVLDDAGADRDRHVHVAGVAQVAAGAAVDAALDGLELVDQLHRPDLGRAGERAGGKGRLQHVDVASSRPAAVPRRC